MKTMRRATLLATVLLAACAGSGGGSFPDVLLGGDPGIQPTDVAATDTAKESGPAVTVAGKPLGPIVTASIDAAGGTLAAADGRLSITVPANAVSAATTFSLQPVATLVPGAIGAGYNLEPHGVTFAQPVTLTFTVPEAGVSRTGVDGLGVALRDDASGQWTWLADATRDAGAKTVAAATTHFCETSVIEGIQLRPLIATVQLGATQALTLANCVQEETLDGKLAGLVYNCDAGLAPLVGTHGWSVNGVAGGNATVGTIAADAGNGQLGTFTAPGQRPSPSTVLAGTWVGASGKRADTFVASNLNIGGPATFHGPVTVVSTGLYEYTAKGDLTLTPSILPNGEYDDGIDMTLWDVSGNLEVKGNILYSGATCVPNESSQAITNTAFNVKKVPLSQLWGLGVQWDMTCDMGGQLFDTAAILQWLTGCMPNEVPFIPLADANHIEGSYTRGGDGCLSAVGTVTVTWDFMP